MLRVQSVQLSNFRGFKEHTVSLDTISVLVGQNNAGKSTFIDALRLLSIAGRKIANAQYQPRPDWLPANVLGYGFRSSFDTIDFDFTNTHHNYDREHPAKLQVVYSNRARLSLWLGAEPGDNFAQISTPTLGPATTRAEAAKIAICPIFIMPPVGSLIPHEQSIAKGRVREFMYGRLASRHFRNQLYELVSEYREWNALLEETWPGVRVSSFTSNEGDSGKEFSLILREGPFASEAAWVGSGLQAWMQILWFLCRAPKDSLIVLDEPDVYLHADMQRKISKLVQSRKFHQAAIATHSAEIISDIDPGAITVIRKRERSSWKPTKKGELQRVIDNLGSRHNIQLSKLASARKIALYEGEDPKYLSELALKISSEAYDRFSSIPAFDIKGVDNIGQAIGAARTLHAATNGEIPVYLIMDRDYRDDDEIDLLTKRCLENHLKLFPWKKKEIENYFICPSALEITFWHRGKLINSTQIEELIKEGCESLKGYTLGAIADQWQLSHKKEAASTAFKNATKIYSSLCADRQECDVISGKRLITELSRISKARWNVSFGAMTLCRNLPLSAAAPELLEITRLLTT